MNEYKILFTGVMGAGKTTAIAAVSDTAPVRTDVANSDESVAKRSTTVGLDYGVMTLDSGDRIRLFGTPGQARFDFLWKILVKNALGLVILSDNSRPDPLSDICIYLDGFAEELKTLPCVVGIGRLERHPVPSIDDYATSLAQRGLVLPIVDADVRRREDVVLLIEMLLTQIDSMLEENQGE